MFPDYPEPNPFTVGVSLPSCLPSGTGLQPSLCNVPLLPHQATVCVPLDSVHHSRSVLYLFPWLPSQEFQDQDVQYLFFKKKEDFVSMQAPLPEEDVDPLFIYKLEQG